VRADQWLTSEAD